MTIDQELTAAATKLVGAPVRVQWVQMAHSEGRAHVDAKSWIVSLNPSIQADGVRMLATLLHEVAHLRLGHTTTPAQYAKSRWRQTDTLNMTVPDGGTAMHLQREVEAWKQAATWAAQLGRRDVAEHCKQRLDADVLNFATNELDRIDARLRRLEATV